ncbi:MAG: tetratricopeptide repeat protein [Chloroflexi bacterium]|nr:tetratricopeptide repeat protein [Chloroflexota bacterium]
MASFSVTLFGTFQVILNGAAVTRFPTDKIRALLIYLLLHADQPLRRDILIGLLWAELPQKAARHNLRQSLYRLRRTFDAIEPNASDKLLTITRQTVQLHGAYVESDVQQMRQLLATDGDDAIIAYAQAVTLYRGEFLAGFFLPDAVAFEEWLLMQREVWSQQILQALHKLTQSYEEQGEMAQVAVYATRQIELEPLRESAYRSLMMAAAKQGQRNKALAYYEACRQLLLCELEIEPCAETIELYEQIKTEGVAIHPASQLPLLLTPLVGRSSEMAEVSQRLNDPSCRLLTLLGSGGIGKTSLAVAIAHLPQWKELFPNGRFFVQLAGTPSADFLVAAIGRGMGLSFSGQQPEKAQLWDYCRAKKCLLILDNFEHLVAGSALLAELTAVAPGIKLLVTSRVSLNIKMEQRLSLTGLSYPTDVMVAGEYSAVELFVQAGRRMQPDFVVTAGNETAVHQICQLVQGSPLAIEFAAAWLRLMDCHQIVAEIKRNISFLAASQRDMPARHQSMLAIFEQSWHLLTPSEQIALIQLAHFRGGFTLDAALTITQATITDLVGLLDNSLLQRDENGRYTLHELLRQFAHSQPQDNLTAFYQDYGRFYLRFIADQENQLRGRNPQQAIKTIQHDLDNVRQAVRWVLDLQMTHDLIGGITELGRFYHVVGLFHEAAQQLQRILAIVQKWLPAVAKTKLLCQLHLQNSHFLGHLGKYETAIEHAHTAQKIAAQLENNEWLAMAHSSEGEWLRHLGKFDLAKDCLATAAAFFPNRNRNRSYAHTLNEIGFVHLGQSQYAATLSAFNLALNIYKMVEDLTEISTTLGNIGYTHQQRGDYQSALENLDQALTIAQTIGYKQGIVNHSISLGNVYLEQGDTERSYTIYQQALQIAKSLGYMRGIVRAQIQLGLALYLKGQLEEADQWYQRAKSQAEEANLQDLLAYVIRKQTLILMQLGKTDEAVAAYKKVIPLLRALNNQQDLGRVMSGLGRLYMRMGNHAQAQTYLEQGLTAVNAAGAKEAIADALSNLGYFYIDKGLYQRAAAYFEETLTLCQQIDHKRGIAVSTSWLATVHSKQGEFEAARQRYEDGLQLSKEIGNETDIGIALANLGGVAKNLKQYEQAWDYYQQALDTLRAIDHKQHLAEISLEQVEIRLIEKRFEQAQLLLSDAVRLAQSVKDEHVMFKGCLLQAQLRHKMGKAETVVADLHAMLTDYSQEKYQAEIHFYLWQITGDEEERKTAVDLYQTLLDTTPDFQYRQHLNKLLEA